MWGQEVVVVRKWLLSGREVVRVALIVRVVVVVMVPRPLAYMAGGQLLHWEALSSAAN